MSSQPLPPPFFPKLPPPGLPKAAWILLFLALVLRLGRLPSAWSPRAWDYAGYPLALLPSLHSAAPWSALSQWIGLHPPGYPLLLLALQSLSARPLVWILASGLASWLAVYWLSRALFLPSTPAPGLPWSPAPPRPLPLLLGMAWLAVSPLQLAYSLELLPYPVLAASLSYLILQAKRASLERRLTGGLALALAVSAYLHVLGAVAGAAVVFLLAPRVLRPSRWQARPYGLIPLILLAVPWVQGLLAVLREPSSFHQPELEVMARLLLIPQRLGWPGAMLILLGVGVALWAAGSLALRVWRQDLRVLPRDPRALPLLLTVGLGGAIVGAQALGAASRHQLSYGVALEPFLAWLLAMQLGQRGELAPDFSPVRGKSFYRQRVIQVTVGIVLCVAAAHGLAKTVHRSLELTRQWPSPLTSPGESHFLLWVSPYRPEDDRDDLFLAFWRLPPWESWEAAPFSLPPHDFRFGWPRAWRGATVYCFSRVQAGPMAQLLHAHGKVGDEGALWLVEGAREPALGPSLRAFLGEQPGWRLRSWEGLPVAWLGGARAGQVGEQWYGLDRPAENQRGGRP